MLGYSTITQKGQVTIPAAIRASLGFLPNSKVIIIQETDGARIRIEPNFFSLRGSIDSLNRPERLERMKTNFRKYLAKRK